jgi:hypothetical protein
MKKLLPKVQTQIQNKAACVAGGSSLFHEILVDLLKSVNLLPIALQPITSTRSATLIRVSFNKAPLPDLITATGS